MKLDTNHLRKVMTSFPGLKSEAQVKELLWQEADDEEVWIMWKQGKDLRDEDECLSPPTSPCPHPPSSPLGDALEPDSAEAQSAPTLAKRTSKDLKPKKAPAKRKANPSTPGEVRKKWRYRPGTRAITDIRKYQKSTDLLLRKLPFQCLIREITQNLSNEIRWQAAVILAIQEAAEAYMVTQLELANLCAIHSKCQTIKPKDFWLVLP